MTDSSPAQPLGNSVARRTLFTAAGVVAGAAALREATMPDVPKQSTFVGDLWRQQHERSD